MTTPDLHTLAALARRIRRLSIQATTRAGSGHPTSCLSAADLMAALFFTQLRYDFQQPHRLDNDRFVLSKGHAAPVLYATWAAAGAVTPAQIETLRELTSDFEGHPTPRLPFVDVATGSLGQGLPNGVGMALYLRDVVKSPARVFVLVGDGELSEGSNWEAAALAAGRSLDNLVVIADINRLEQSIATRYGWDLDRYRAIFQAFGWEALSIDGNDMSQCVSALGQAVATSGRPVVILARTQKGAGVPFLADKPGWHGKPLSTDQAAQALAELGDDDGVTAPVARPEGAPLAPPRGQHREPAAPHHDAADRPIATRRAFGEALRRLGAEDPDLMVFDADVKNSTYTELFEKDHPDRFVQCYIAEQVMVGAAAGAGALGATPVCATFAAFFSRAFDQLRMAALSQTNLKLVGTHAGTHIGEDGGSQMGLEDLALLRAVQGSTVVYPADPYATEALLRELCAQRGIGYLRATRGETPVLYDAQEAFPIGGSKTLRHSDADRCVVVAAGITLHEALKAHELLAIHDGVAVRVIDAYSVKPIDAAGLRAAARACGGRVIVVEDHRIEGGLGDAVLGALAEEDGVRVKKLAVHELPHSGRPEELLELYGLSAGRIAQAVRGFLE